MAIKTVSQLDRFDNGSSGSYGSFAIGGNLRLLNGETLTDKDKGINVPENWQSTNGKWTPGIANNSYWGSLFEISKPINPSRSTDARDTDIEYESQSITYQNLMENIVWDVKSYLNARHNLSNFDFLSVIHRNYTFTGNKTFDNNVTIKGNTLLGNDRTADRVTIDAAVTNNGTLTQNGTSQFAADATFNTWAKINNLSIAISAITDCDISCKTRDIVFDGWSFGLVDRDYNGALTHTKTNIGTYNGSVTPGLTGSRVGDPVCFVNGRPYELTAVNYAMNSYNLVDRTTGRTWNVGNGTYRSNANKTGDNNYAQNTERYSAVYFKNGKPYTTNVIKYAECAYWSDLGEKYLADNVYEPGTLVKFGGEKEITIADTEVNAIVSTKAFELNNKLIDGTVIALCGRVPTKVKGRIEKFDKIMLSDIPGVACKWDGASRVIGRALESNLNEDIKLVECVTRFEI